MARGRAKRRKERGGCSSPAGKGGKEEGREGGKEAEETEDAQERS